MRFEFDQRKNEANQLKHHVSFEEASLIWGDSDLLVLHAKKRGEKRMLAIGRAYAVLHTVIHTKRGDVIRIISARLSSESERRIYERHSNH